MMTIGGSRQLIMTIGGGRHEKSGDRMAIATDSLSPMNGVGILLAGIWVKDGANSESFSNIR
ncbi:MAG: hypothetical protein K5683_00890 [Prevotella sp.]|nr:hypothetical protein [Prevotella sp.]